MKKCEYLENRKRWRYFKRLFDPQGGTRVSYANRKNFNFRHFWRPSWILAENEKLYSSPVMLYIPRQWSCFIYFSTFIVITFRTAMFSFRESYFRLVGPFNWGYTRTHKSTFEPISGSSEMERIN